MPLKFITVNDNVFQILGDFISKPPRLCSSTISLKNPLSCAMQMFILTMVSAYCEDALYIEHTTFQRAEKFYRICVRKTRNVCMHT